MKTLILLFFLAAGSAALADTDAFQNSDFSQGLAEWEGDCHTAGSSSDDSNSTVGVVIKLRDGDWTKIGQEFDGKPGSYILSITYQVTPNLSLSVRPEDYTNVTGSMGLNGLSAISTQPGDWAIMMVDSGETHYHYWQIAPTLTPGVHTITANVTIDSGDDYKKGFYLGFPPGSGTVNLQAITLLPYGTSTAAQ